MLLPDEAHDWPLERRRSVLLHEMAHVARWNERRVVAEVVLAINWFNPLVWVAVARLRVEREHACDDVVLARGTRASDYASDLLNLARTLRPAADPSFASLPMARESELEGRLVAILDPRRRRGSARLRVRVLSAVLAAPFITNVAARHPAVSAHPSRSAPSPATSVGASMTAATTRVTSPEPLLRLSGASQRSRWAKRRAPVDTPPVPAATRDTSTPRSRADGKLPPAAGVTDSKAAQTQQTQRGTHVDSSSGYPIVTDSDDTSHTRVVGINSDDIEVFQDKPAGDCVRFVIDGVPKPLHDPGELREFIRPGQVAAIEIYSPPNVPAQFQTGGQPSCDVLVIRTQSKRGIDIHVF